MIDFQNIKAHNWGGTSISIIGAGKSGISAANLGKHLGSQIFISDNNDSPDIQKNIQNFDHETGCHSDKILDAHLIVISPGVPDHIPIIQECKERNNAFHVCEDVEPRPAKGNLKEEGECLLGSIPKTHPVENHKPTLLLQPYRLGNNSIGRHIPRL